MMQMLVPCALPRHSNIMPIDQSIMLQQVSQALTGAKSATNAHNAFWLQILAYGEQELQAVT